MMQDLREQLVIASRRSYERGLQVGNGGNLSARIPGQERMLVTGSGASFIDCDPSSFLLIDFDGNVIEGEGKPTKEAYMHAQIYRLKPGVSSIVHVHSVFANTLSHFDEEIQLGTYHSRLKIPGRIPIIHVPSPMVRPKDWATVERVLMDNPETVAFVLRDHGTIALGSNPIAAEHLAELVEETAQFAYQTEILASARR